MDKRRFLKATGVTFVASLLASPFFARSSASSTLAQDDSSLEERFTQLKNQFADLQDKLAKEIRDREAAVDVLSNSFIGSVVAIPYDREIPRGWHLCDGTAFEPGEYPKLRKLGMDSFPDYRGVFLRGLNDGRETLDGKPFEFDPWKERKLGDFQDSANKKHSHGTFDKVKGQYKTYSAGEHDHETRTGIYDKEAKKLIDDGDHPHNDPKAGPIVGLNVSQYKNHYKESPPNCYLIGGSLVSEEEIAKTRSSPIFRMAERELTEKVLANSIGVFEIAKGAHHHAIKSDGKHEHVIPEAGDDESRPKNVSVRYIIKCGPKEPSLEKE